MAQPREPRLTPQRSGVQYRGFFFWEPFIKDPTRHNSSESIRFRQRRVAIDPLGHGNKELLNQACSGNESFLGYPRRRGSHPVHSTPPQIFEIQRQAQRMSSRLAISGAQQTAGCLLLELHLLPESLNQRNCRIV